MILILGEQGDLHIRAVCAHLDEARVRYFVVDPLEAVRLPDLIHPNSGAGEYSAIWDRQKPVAAPKSNQDQYVFRERIAAIRSLQLLHGQERLMNPPSGTEAARSKLFQLRIAHEAGFDTPKTYIGNDPKIVRNFIKTCKTGVVAKSLTWFFDADNRFSFTNIITSDTLSSDAAIAYSPLIYQEYIIKRFELRVTCVGKKVFAAKVFSQANPKTIVDWRRDQFNLCYEAVSLPAAFERKITGILQALGIHFGAFDFIVTPERRCVFLEVNSSGNWLWIEKQLPLPISVAIAEWLCAHHSAGGASPRNGKRRAKR